MGIRRTNGPAGRMKGCIFSSSIGKSATCLEASFYEKYIVMLNIHVWMLERLKYQGEFFLALKKEM